MFFQHYCEPTYHVVRPILTLTATQELQCMVVKAVQRGSMEKYLGAMFAQTEAPSGERRRRDNRGAEVPEWSEV